MHAIMSLVLALASALVPARGWCPPDGPVNVNIKAEGEAKLVLTDFLGNPLEAKGPAEVSGEATKDLKTVFESLSQPGVYLLYLVPKGKQLPDFQGTPLVISVRNDTRNGAPPGPMVIKIEPLRYAVLHTKQGDMTMAFYYDVAPHTTDNFLDLAADKYYDNLTFHRIVPGFVIQGGDPRGDGTGGPGYQIDGEFNERQHLPGVLSMARGSNPDSAGSQFFVCLDYQQTQQLDRKYTAFGKVMSGMEAVNAIAKAPLADPENGKPKEPQVIESVEVKPVVPGENPYAALQKDLAPGKAAEQK